MLATRLRNLGWRNVDQYVQKGTVTISVRREVADCRKRVLIVEDEPLIAMELEALVAEAGCEVVGPASTCDTGLGLLHEGGADAAIIDYMLADESCERIASELFAREIPWSLASGFDKALIEERFRQVPVLAKPYDEREVREMLTRLLTNGAT